MDTKRWLVVAGIVIVALVLSLILVLNTGQDTIFVREQTQNTQDQFGVQYSALVYNGEGLIDHTDVLTPEYCHAENLGMEVEIYPCNANSFSSSDLIHDLKFTWNGGQTRNTTWIFVYEGRLEEASLEKGTVEYYNITKQVGHEEYIVDHQINNVVGFEYLGNPSVEICDRGTENNTFAYEVTRTVNGSSQLIENYCFSEYQVLGGGSYLLSGNATLYEDVQVQKERYVFTEVGSVEYMGNDLLGNGFDYYKVEDVPFSSGQERVARWRYTPYLNRQAGKWHIFGYDSSMNLNDAIDQGLYVYMDPSWTAGLSEGLTAYWNGSSGEDLVTGTYNLTVNAGTPTYQGSNCKIGDCIDFDSGDVIDVSNSASDPLMRPEETRGWTLNVWIRMNSDGAESYPFYKEGTGEYWDVQSRMHNDDKWKMQWTGGSIAHADMPVMSITTYYMMTWTQNSTSICSWVDGVLYTCSAVPTLGANTNTLQFNGNTNAYDGQFDEIGMWNRSLSSSEISELYNGGDGITYVPTSTVVGDYNVQLVDPADNTITSNQMINFTAHQNATGEWENINSTLFLWNSTSDLLNETTNILAGNGTNVTTWNISNSLDDGAYDWNVFGWWYNGSDYVGNWSFNGNFSFEVDTTAPTIVFNTTIEDQFVEAFPHNVTLDVITSDDHLDACWYYTSDSSTNITYTCNTTTEVEFSSGGQKTIYAVANDTLGFEFQNSTTFDIGTYLQAVDIDPIGEGQTANFSLELNKTGISSETVTPILVYNNTNYGGALISSTSANRTLVVKPLTIPDGTGSPTGNVIDWHWEFNITNVGNYTASTLNQTVYSVDIDDCTTYGEVILNFSLRDEATRDLVNASGGSTIELDLDLSSKADSSIAWEYSNTWTNNNTAVVCVPSELLNNSEYRIDFVAEYVSTDRVTEFYYLDNGTLSLSDSFNSLTNKTIDLYDLAIADSTTFLFSFLDEDNLEVPNAIVHTFRQYIGQGVFYEVERAKQDDNGETHLHLVEEDVIYYFIISKDGQILFTSSTYNAKCLSTPCSIELEASPDFQDFGTDWDLIPNGTMTVSDDAATREVTLAFSTSDAATMNLTIAKQDYTGDLTVIDSDQTTASSGTITITVPQSAGNVTYYAIVYRNGEYISHSIVDFTDNTAYFGSTGSVMGFFTIIALILMGATEGILLFVFLILALILVSALALFKLGYYALIGLICAVGILVWKLIKRGRRFA